MNRIPIGAAVISVFMTLSGCGGGSDATLETAETDPATATLGAELVPSFISAELESSLVPDAAASAAAATSFPAELLPPIS
ncbi:MAG: hypothetical protein RLZZ352_2600 [Pseudomonadota bacterium]|jgi:hypothetical protein